MHLPTRRSSSNRAHRSAWLAAVAVAAFAAHTASPLAAQSRAGAAGGIAARVDSLVAAYQRTTRVPGVSVAVIRGGRDTVVYRGYGLADLENGVQATPRTVYRI